MLAAKNSVKETEFWDPKWDSGKKISFFYFSPFSSQFYR